MAINSNILQIQSVNEIMKCNDLTEQYGLFLTLQQAKELVETRLQELNSNGRIEFGGGIVEKIIKEFHDSPYLIMENYADYLHQLVEIFYFYKNETMDLIGDDELIRFMKDSFDGVCNGSLELLAGKELYRMARNLRYGRDPYYSEEDEIDMEEYYDQY